MPVPQTLTRSLLLTKCRKFVIDLDKSLQFCSVAGISSNRNAIISILLPCFISLDKASLHDYVEKSERIIATEDSHYDPSTSGLGFGVAAADEIASKKVYFRVYILNWNTVYNLVWKSGRANT